MSVLLRTSALPKLALCPSFTGAAGDAGPYAMRGTLADEAFRLTHEGQRLHECACGEYFNGCDCGPDEETGSIEPLDVLDARIEKLAEEHGIANKPAAEGVRWAIAKMKEIAGDGVNCITEESELVVTTEGLDADGVADGNAPSVRKGFDLKTGKISNYMEQMAGYALGFMARDFLDDYEMHLLFMDDKQVITHKFTYEEARRIVLGIRAKVLDPDKKPVLNPYCNWCEYATTCTARTEAAQRALEHANGLNLREGLGEIGVSHSKLGDFLSACDALKPFEQIAQGKARWRLEEEKPVKGWRLTRVRGIKSVTPASAIRHTKKLPKGEELTLEKLFTALGDLTPFQFKRIMQSVNKPLPKSFTKQGRASTYLMRKNSHK